jgi:hypothetical protein
MQIYQTQRTNTSGKWQPPGRHAITHDPDLGLLAAALIKRRTEVEYELLSLVLADPARESCAAGVAMAKRFGITIDSFEADDLALIFSAAAFASDRPLGTVLRLARRILQYHGMWDSQASSFSRGSRWSDEMLVNLADGWPSCTFIPAYAAKLKELARRSTKAAEHYGYVSHLLTVGAA